MELSINFLTWNINDNRIKNKKTKLFFQDLNAELIQSKIDILVLQECFFDDHFSELIDFIEIDGFIEKGRGIKKWVRMFLNKNSKIDYNSSTPYAKNKFRCVELITSFGFAFNLMGAHFHTETGKSYSQQFFENEDIPLFIKEFESKKTKNSIIVGDLNYKPFDVTLSHPHFLNATNDKNIIDTFKTRKVKTKNIRYFYNPMWNLLGDYGYNKMKKPAGSYYWYPNDVVKSHWNLIDGVLLSESVMNNINIESIKILTEINGKQLIKDKITIKKPEESLLTDGFSDHLPISFTLKTT